MSADDESKAMPKSMRHKQILDVAAENPDASIEELASMVASATPDLVERVFDEHGDPAAEADTATQSEDSMSHSNGSESQSDGSESEATTESHSETGETDEYPSLDELSETRRELVELVAAQPEATQEKIADHFGVTRATVSRWANDIEGFEWRDREDFVAAVFDEPPSPGMTTDGGSTSETGSADAKQTGSDQPPSTDEGTAVTTADLETEIERLSERVTDIEKSYDEATAGSDTVFEDPELVHKVVHACMESETISEAEELRIIEELLA